MANALPTSTDLPTGGLLRWRQHADHYAGGDYTLRLLAPYAWEVRHLGEVVDVVPSRKLAFRLAEIDHRERTRRHDMKRWGALALAGFGGLMLFFLVEVGDLWLVLVAGGVMYFTVSAVARFAAAASRSRTDPYRRLEPWERRRRWWRRRHPPA